MYTFTCNNCGSSDYKEENGYRICSYCGTKYAITAEDKPAVDSNIELNEDVARLLQKCKEEPERANKFAQRILEIDPSNAEARRIMAEHLSKNNSKSGCYIATAVYGSYDCPEVWTLRRYRDNVLAETWYGRAFIYTYYAISPTLVKWFGDRAWFRNIWKPRLDRMVCRLNTEGMKNTPYQDKIW